MERVLVTGGAGYIGKKLVDRIREQGSDVVNYDRKNGNDLCKKGFLNNLGINFDYIFHLAADLDQDRSYQNNVLGVSNILYLASKQKGLKKIIFTSSAAVYESSRRPVDEESTKKAMNNYAASKVVGEQLFREASKEGIPTLIARLFNVYGPNQEGNVVSIFANNLRKNEVMNVNDHGEQTRDYIYVDDVVTGLIKLARSPITGETYNFGTGEPTSIMDLIVQLQTVTNQDIKMKKNKKKIREIEHSVADTFKYDMDFGKLSTINLKEGLQKVLECKS